VTAYAASRTGSRGHQSVWAWECQCGSLLAKTYLTPDGAPLHTLLELRDPVRVRQAERDGVPAFGPPRKARHGSLTGVPEAALWRQTGGRLRVSISDQQLADHNPLMPLLFDTWCSCGRRNRIDVARRSQVKSIP
jgi:hypothetical protein